MAQAVFSAASALRIRCSWVMRSGGGGGGGGGGGAMIWRFSSISSGMQRKRHLRPPSRPFDASSVRKRNETRQQQRRGDRRDHPHRNAHTQPAIGQLLTAPVRRQIAHHFGRTRRNIS